MASKDKRKLNHFFIIIDKYYRPTSQLKMLFQALEFPKLSTDLGDVIYVENFYSNVRRKIYRDNMFINNKHLSHRNKTFLSTS